MALFPLHIATRGLLDGEYGKATRGYIICPDIVPRFPQDADVDSDGSWAVVAQLDLEAILADYPRLTFEAALGDALDLVVTVDGERYDASALVTDVGLMAEVLAMEDVVGEAVEPGFTGEISADRDIGDVTEEDEAAVVAEIDGLVGDADDGPPHC